MDLQNRITADLATKPEEIAVRVADRYSRFTQRLAAFVDDQCVLAHLLEKCRAPHDSALAQTLALRAVCPTRWACLGGAVQS